MVGRRGSSHPFALAPRSGERERERGPRSHAALRLQLVSQISVENIGKMYGVAQATASRWLASARERVQGEVLRVLRERLGASPDEIASLVGVVASQIDLSISRLLSPADVRR